VLVGLVVFVAGFYLFVNSQDLFSPLLSFQASASVVAWFTAPAYSFALPELPGRRNLVDDSITVERILHFHREF
jgi:hypothetical protein